MLSFVEDLGNGEVFAGGLVVWMDTIIPAVF